jgi:putative membrane protein
MNPLMLDAVLASVHHLFVFSLVAVLFAELVLAGGAPDAARLRQLGKLDGAYGLLSMGIIAAGFLRAVYGAKGWSFYAHNPVFWTKIGLFVVVGLLSAVPTVRLVRWRKAGIVPDAAAMRSTRQWMLAEVALVALIPIVAVLMARGVGYR